MKCTLLQTVWILCSLRWSVTSLLITLEQVCLLDLLNLHDYDDFLFYTVMDGRTCYSNAGGPHIANVKTLCICAWITDSLYTRSATVTAHALAAGSHMTRYVAATTLLIFRLVSPAALTS